MLLNWYASQTPQVQSALQGLVVMGLFAVIKACLHYAGKPLGQDAAAKVGKLLAVAVATATSTLVSQHGYTGQFWWAWFTAFASAVGSWELLSKAWTFGAGEAAPAREETVDELSEGGV